MKPYRVVTIYHAKGGVGKTTTTLYDGQGLAEAGEDVELVDADPGSESLASHALMLRDRYPYYEHPWHISQWLPKYGLLGDFISDRHEASGARLFMLDTNPEEFNARAALQLADLIVVPCTPSQYDIENLAKTYRLAEVRRAGAPVRVLLTRVERAGAGAAAEVRAQLQDAGYELFGADITRNAGLYARRFGRPIEDLGEYAEVAKETAVLL